MSMIDTPAIIKNFWNFAHFVITWKGSYLGNTSKILAKWNVKTECPISLLVTDKGFWYCSCHLRVKVESG